MQSETRYASPGLRLTAFVVDLFTFQIYLSVLLLPLFGIYLGADALGLVPRTDPGVAVSLRIGVLVLAVWSYFTFGECSKFQATPGKLFLGLRVTDVTGNRLTLFRSNLRFWTRLLALLPLGLGYVTAFFNGRKQALHDLLSRSTVTVKRAA